MPLFPVSEFDPIEPEAEVRAEALNDHQTTMTARLIERWKDKPNLQVMLDSLAAEVQELEDAIIKTMLSRIPEFAEGVQLDLLGRIVGQLRNGLDDDSYRAHINARIAINQSFGLPDDLINIIRILSDAGFSFYEYPIASMLFAFLDPLETDGLAGEITTLLGQARAAGTRLLVTMPVNRDTPERNGFFGSYYDPTLNVARGWGSYYDSTIGGLFGHAETA